MCVRSCSLLYMRSPRPQSITWQTKGYVALQVGETVTSCQRSAWRASAHFNAQPDAGIGPPSLCGGHRDTERGCRVVKIQADEVTQLHQLRLLRIDSRKSLQGCVDSEQPVVVRHGGCNFDL